MPRPRKTHRLSQERIAELRSNPLAWLVELDGLVVDARVLPADALRSLRRRGIVPDIDPSPDPTSTR